MRILSCDILKNVKIRALFHPTTRARLKYVLGVVLLAALYFITGRLGLKFDAASGFATLIWAPSGIAIAALFLFGFRYVPAIFLGAFLTNLSIGAAPFVALGIGFGNMLEAVIGVGFLRIFKFEASLTRVQHIITLILPVAGLATAIAAFCSVTTLYVAGAVYASAYIDTWLSWWIGDMMGILLVTPVIFVWSEFIRKKRTTYTTASNSARIFEGMFAFGTLIVFALTIFFLTPGVLGTSRSFIYLIFLPFIWISFRFRQLGSATAIFLTAIIAIWGTTFGMGPFVGSTLREGLVALQLFLGTASVTTLLLAATVTERERVLYHLEVEEEEMAQEKARVDAAFLSIGDGLVVTDREGKIVMVNHAFEGMLGWGQNEVVGKRFADVVSRQNEDGSVIPFAERYITRTLAGESIAPTGRTDGYFVRKDGTRFPTSIIVNPIGEGAENISGAVEAFRDVTKEKEIDKAKTEFVSLASHELRTPATAISWLSERLLSGKSGPMTPKQEEYSKEIHRSNQHMIESINALLNISRIELGVFAVSTKPTDIPVIVKRIFSDLSQEIAQKKLSVTEHHSAHLTPVLADEKLLYIILHNLIGNAIHYSKKDGEIHVSTARHTTGDSVGGRTMTEDSCVVSVKDTGCGIPAKQQDQIFTRFFRADNASKTHTDGTGLGLYTVKLILDQVGGSIWFQSEEDKGSIFYLALPATGMRQRSGTKELVWRETPPEK